MRLLPILLLSWLLIDCSSHHSKSTLSQVGSSDLSQGNIVGAIAYTASVDKMGQGSVTIPMSAIAAGNGFQPKLSLSYYSGNETVGTLGYGWSLGPSSSIRRCSRSDFFDGNTKSPDLSTKDRLCLDNQKLVLKSGFNLEDGAEYGLLREDFSRIRFYKSNDTDPGFFVVWRKNGEIQTFGSSNQSRFSHSSGKGISWVLDQLKDRSGNIIDFVYQTDEIQKQPLLKAINYGGNETFSVAHYRSIQFDYESLVNPVSGFYLGDFNVTKSRLKSIVVLSEGKVNWNYKIDYLQFKNQASEVPEKIEQCFSDGTCFLPTRFQYQHSDFYLKEVPSVFKPFGISTPTLVGKVARYLIDVNNDGRDDVVGVSQKIVYLEKAAADQSYLGVEEYPTGMPSSWNLQRDPLFFYDVDADGFVDILTSVSLTGPGVAFEQTGFYLIKGSSTGFSSAKQVYSGFNFGPDPRKLFITLQDLTHDNKPEIILFTNDGVQILANKPDGFESLTGSQVAIADFGFKQGWTFDRHPRQILDLNSDGNPDIVGFADDGIYVALGSGTTFSKPEKWTGDFGRVNGQLSYGIETHLRLFTDVNNDGLPDVVGFHTEGVWVGLNTGNGFLPQELWIKDLASVQNFREQNQTRIVHDMNGDGYADFIGISQSKIKIYLGSGHKLLDPLPENVIEIKSDAFIKWQKGKHPIAFHDVDGDGLTDIDFIFGDGIRTFLNTSKPLRMSGVVDGFKKETQFNYQTSSTSSVYKKSRESLYPFVTLPAAGLLVSDLLESDGLGGFKKLSYTYQNAIFHRAGLGFVGFDSWQTFDEAAKIKTINRYATEGDINFLGLPLSQETYRSDALGDSLMSKVETIWSANSISDALTHSYVFSKKIRSIKNDKQGRQLSEVIAEQEYDDLGNITQSKVTTKDDFGTRLILTENSYGSENINDWILGRITRAKVTYSKPGYPDVLKASSFAYDTDGQLVTETVEPNTNLETSKSYDRRRNKFGQVDTSTVSWTQEQASGLAGTKKVDLVDFDSQGFIQKSTNSLGYGDEVIERDPATGLVKKVRNPNGLETSYLYDATGRMKEVKDPDGVMSTVEYQWCDATCPVLASYFVVSKTSDLPPKVEYIDGLGRTIRKSSVGFKGKVIFEDFVYSKPGLLLKKSLPYFSDADSSQIHWTNYIYSDLMQLVTVVNPDGSQESVNPDRNAIAATNALGSRTVKTVDSDGHLIKVTNDLNESINYEYDAAGRMISATDPVGNKTIFEYDARDRRISIQDPNTGKTTNSFNALDLPFQSQDQLGKKIFTFYDLLGRPTKKVYSGKGAEVIDRWSYDSKPHGFGFLDSASGDNYLRSIERDELGRPVRIQTQIGSKSYVQMQTYDRLSRPFRTVYPSGLTVENVYDAFGVNEKIRNSDSQKVYWEVLKFNALGSVEQFKSGNKLTTYLNFDQKNGRLLGTNMRDEGMTLISGQAYSYDVSGNLISRTDSITGDLEAFTYDKLSRLKRVESNHSRAVEVTYDKIGNIASRSDIGTYGYGGTCGTQKAGPQAVTSVGIDQTFCYNAKGQLVSSNDRLVDFGPKDLPVEISKGRAKVNLSYGPDLQKYEQVEIFPDGSKEATRVIDEGYEETESSEGLEQRHFIGANTLVSLKQGQETETYFHRDHLGSVIALVGSLGEVKERIKYDPWGQKKSFDLEQSNGSGLIKSNRGYTGHDHMDSIGLIHMKGRVYDPSIGRFLSADPYIQDPENLQSFNRYSYVWNNPLSATDPSGNFTWSINNVGKTISKGFGDANNAIDKAGRDLGGAGRKINTWVNQPQNQRLVATIAIASLAAIAAPAAAAWALQYGSWASWAAGTAVSGAGGYISGYVASDGNLEYSRKSALTAMAFYTVGSSFPAEGKMTAGMRAAKVIAHGAVGGFASLNSGGTFESGFLSTAVSEAMTTFDGYNSIASGIGVNSQSLAFGTISAVLVGGSISELSGGSFENGAISAAFGRLFNHETHKVARAIEKTFFWGMRGGANGFGHSAVEFRMNDGTSEFFEKYPTEPGAISTPTSDIRSSDVVSTSDLVSGLEREKGAKWSGVEVALTNPEAAYAFATDNQRINTPYQLVGNSCLDYARETIRAGRPADPVIRSYFYREQSVPNTFFRGLSNKSNH